VYAYSDSCYAAIHWRMRIAIVARLQNVNTERAGYSRLPCSHLLSYCLSLSLATHAALDRHRGHAHDRVYQQRKYRIQSELSDSYTFNKLESKRGLSADHGAAVLDAANLVRATVDARDVENFPGDVTAPAVAQGLSGECERVEKVERPPQLMQPADDVYDRATKYMAKHDISQMFQASLDVGYAGDAIL